MSIFSTLKSWTAESAFRPISSTLLFQDFAQISTSISRKYGGTGLGLAISQRLVQAMCGTISVRSVPEHGNTFWFTARLPATEAPETLKRDLVQAVLRRVLVADDNYVNQIVLEALLKKDGHEAVLASDGAPRWRRCKPETSSSWSRICRCR
jgi:CheY-like chemotaxis protein